VGGVSDADYGLLACAAWPAFLASGVRGMNHEAIEPAEKKRRKTPSAIIWFTWACAIWIVGDLAAVALPAYQAAQAVRTLRAIDFACSLLADYHDTKAAWPKSWEDLRQVGEGRSWIKNTWPDDEDELRSRVKIDFDKLPHNAAEAVTPIGYCYDYQDRPGYLRLKSLSESPSIAPK
jgi:hypothetical protein